MAHMKTIDPRHARSLINELDVYQAELYPAESNHLDSIESLCAENVCMLGAYEGTELVAIGAVKLLPEYAEIKRVYVPPRHRSKGLAKMIMGGLEQIAAKHGLQVARLETGVLQHEAIGLYHHLGYSGCAAFGVYKQDPLSVFMQKALMPKK